MPTYEYHCPECTKSFEVRLSIAEYSQRGAPSCPQCGSPHVTRCFTPVNVAVGGRSDDGPAPSCEGGSCCCG